MTPAPHSFTTTAGAAAMPLLTIHEVAAALKVSAEHARQLCVSGRLPWIDVGTKSRAVRRVRRDTLDAFMRAERQSKVVEEVRNVERTLAAAAAVEERW